MNSYNQTDVKQQKVRNRVLKKWKNECDINYSICFGISYQQMNKPDWIEVKT